MRESNRGSGDAVPILPCGLLRAPVDGSGSQIVPARSGTNALSGTEGPTDRLTRRNRPLQCCNFSGGEEDGDLSIHVLQACVCSARCYRPSWQRAWILNQQ